MAIATLQAKQELTEQVKDKIARYLGEIGDTNGVIRPISSWSVNRVEHLGDRILVRFHQSAPCYIDAVRFAGWTPEQTEWVAIDDLKANDRVRVYGRVYYVWEKQGFSLVLLPADFKVGGDLYVRAALERIPGSSKTKWERVLSHLANEVVAA